MDRLNRLASLVLLALWPVLTAGGGGGDGDSGSDGGGQTCIVTLAVVVVVVALFIGGGMVVHRRDMAFMRCVDRDLKEGRRRPTPSDYERYVGLKRMYGEAALPCPPPPEEGTSVT